MAEEQGSGPTGSEQGSGSDTEKGSGSQQGSEGSESSNRTEAGTPDAQALVQKATAEAARYHSELKQARKKLEAYEQANLSEKEKLENRIKELEGTLQTKDEELLTIKTQNAVTGVAAKLSFVNPALAHRLIDPKSITYDEAGKPTNVEALLKEIAKSDPYLVGRRSVDAGQGGGSATGGSSMNDRLRQAAGRA